MFNGVSLDGWEGDSDWFRIEDGCIVAGDLEQKIPHNFFLCTERVFGDFELTLEMKLEGEGKNAGVQFRSKRQLDSTEVIGYQMDAGAAWKRPVWGALYDESRRRKMLAEPAPEVIENALQSGWNQMRLKCVGSRIQIFVNDIQTVDYIEPDDAIERTGVIGLQIHSGPPSEAWYRNISITEL